MSEHKRILVVDDEPQITRVLRTSLSSQGYDIRVANDGETALEIMKDWTPDMVITDLAMPNMGGLELCRRLRTTTQVPIVVLSVRGEEKTKVQALDAGADDYVTKPFGMEELLARVRANLRQKERADCARVDRRARARPRCGQLFQNQPGSGISRRRLQRHDCDLAALRFERWQLP